MGTGVLFPGVKVVTSWNSSPFSAKIMAVLGYTSTLHLFLQLGASLSTRATLPYFSNFKTKLNFIFDLRSGNGRVQDSSEHSRTRCESVNHRSSFECKLKIMSCKKTDVIYLTCWAAFCKLRSGSLLLLRKSRNLFSLGGGSFLR